MALKKFAELGTANRGDPCQEYPGKWLIHYPYCLEEIIGENGEIEQSSLDDAKCAVKGLIRRLEEKQIEYNPRDITISWKCSDNDPRIGQVWFTGFYVHGRFSFFGQYES